MALWSTSLIIPGLESLFFERRSATPSLSRGAPLQKNLLCDPGTLTEVIPQEWRLREEGSPQQHREQEFEKTRGQLQARLPYHLHENVLCPRYADEANCQVRRQFVLRSLARAPVPAWCQFNCQRRRARSHALSPGRLGICALADISTLREWIAQAVGRSFRFTQ